MKRLLHWALSLATPHSVLADPCIDSSPSKLEARLRQRFADERLPVATDSAKENRMERGREGKCLLAARLDLMVTDAKTLCCLCHPLNIAGRIGLSLRFADLKDGM